MRLLACGHFFFLASSAVIGFLNVHPIRRSRIIEQVMVGTFGTLNSLYLKRFLKFQSMRIVVFDEADEMLKVGGYPATNVALSNIVIHGSLRWLAHLASMPVERLPKRVLP